MKPSQSEFDSSIGDRGIAVRPALIFNARYNAAVPRLIINADDFGLTRGVNRAIAEAHSQGIITSATLMANSSAFEDAVKLTRELPRLSVGCHIILVDGIPILESSRVRTLVAGNTGRDGQFRTSLAAFAGSVLTGRVDESQVEAESTAQIKKLQASGVRVSHVDTHKHTHMFPAVARPLLRAARACGVRAVRNPFSPCRPLPMHVLRQQPHLWKRYLQVRALGSLQPRFLRLVANADMITSDGSLGIVATGVLDLALFETLIESIPPGTWELVCHPGYSDSDLDKVRTTLRHSRVQELKLLTSATARVALSRRGIELCSYRELADSAKSRPTG
jgi:chitin disaccharide deacetylase